MKKQELIDFIKDKGNWTRNPPLTHELWSYAKITKTVSVGKQRFDWAILVRGKNKGFYYTERYGNVPEEMISDLLNKYLKKS